MIFPYPLYYINLCFICFIYFGTFLHLFPRGSLIWQNRVSGSAKNSRKRILWHSWPLYVHNINRVGYQLHVKLAWKGVGFFFVMYRIQDRPLRIFEGVQDPKCGPFGQAPKQNPQFWTHFLAQVGPFGCMGLIKDMIFWLLLCLGYFYQVLRWFHKIWVWVREGQ